MILEVSISNFRKDLKNYFDAVRHGEKVVIKQGNDAFTLVPVTDDDLYFTPDMVAKINKSIAQIGTEKSKRVRNLDELRQLLDARKQDV